METDSEGHDAAALASDLSQATWRLSRVLRFKQLSSVSMLQISALVGLALHGPMTPGELAHYEQVKPPSMTRVLGLLETAGLVDRTKHPTDGRQVIVAISKAGVALVAAERSNRQRWLWGRVEPLPRDQQETLRAAARIMMDMAQE